MRFSLIRKLKLFMFGKSMSEISRDFGRGLAKGSEEMKLNETVEMMHSDDYRERFKAEHLQLRIRIEGLEEMLEGYKYNTLGFEPSCSYELLHAQLASMKAYQAILQERARIEHIKLY